VLGDRPVERRDVGETDALEAFDQVGQREQSHLQGGAGAAVEDEVLEDLDGAEPIIIDGRPLKIAVALAAAD